MSQQATRRPHLITRTLTAIRECHASFHLGASATVGLLIYAALPDSLGLAIRGTLSWDAAILVFFLLLAYALGQAPAERIRARIRAQDTSHTVILVLVVVAALVSLAAVLTLLGKPDHESAAALALRAILAGSVVVCSWTLIHTMFAIHYAHGYYGNRGASGPKVGGLQFPDEAEEPDFWDFVYFSLVIGMTCQVSDVQITSRPMRRLASIHGVLSFFFNTVILALTVNILVSAV
ncbi:MAG: DUF1345 domain-containing protein [Alphaproteobacteria bacterium]|nr:DUF1345 domain-containing protein [Alphaproteobacteria bacterium]